MGPGSNRRSIWSSSKHSGGDPSEADSRSAGPLPAGVGQPSPVFEQPRDALATAPDGVVDPEALADMQVFKDLRAKRKKQRKRKIVATVSTIAGVVIVAVVAMMWHSAALMEQARQAAIPQTAPVQRGTFTEKVSASGNLKPLSQVSATPEVEGIVGEVFVSEGDQVEEGQKLFTVTNDKLDKAVSQAQQGIQAAQNGVDQARSSLDEAKRSKQAGKQAAAQAAKAAQAARKQAAALPAGAAPSAAAASQGGGPAAFDEAAADAGVKQAEFALASANIALQQAQAAYDEAVAQAAKRTVSASIAGSVIAVNIEPGKALGAAADPTATAGPPVQIADLSQMTVSVAVNEIDILKVALDQEATVSFSAAPDLSLPARVVNIATTSTASPTSQGPGPSGGAVTYAVKLLIASPDPRLKPGMTAKATIVTKTIDNALMVPVAAVQTDDKKASFVMVVADPETNEAERRSVEVLASDGMTSAVKGQVAEGDQVVVAGGAGGPSSGGSEAGEAALGQSGSAAMG